jgi:hypothetical protein
VGTSVTFETKCYQDDWTFIIEGRHLHAAIASCDYAFDRRVLYLNNFESYDEPVRAAERLVAEGVIDEFHVVKDHAAAALESLGIAEESFGRGYHYSIAELVAIYLTKTDYLLHFSGDSKMGPGQPPWIDQAIDALDTRPELLVANPTWNAQFAEAKSEAFTEDDDWYYSHGFSDQCYLVQTTRFQQPIYNEQHAASARYPAYGGELFEKRVDAYMRNHLLYRITSKHAAYLHRNFPKR